MERTPTDKGEMVLFINGQFMRLGMFFNTEKNMRDEFIRQLDSRSKWWVLMRVVEYVNNKEKQYFGWCDW